MSAIAELVLPVDRIDPRARPWYKTFAGIVDIVSIFFLLLACILISIGIFGSTGAGGLSDTDGAFFLAIVVVPVFLITYSIYHTDDRVYPHALSARICLYVAGVNAFYGFFLTISHGRLASMVKAEKSSFRCASAGFFFGFVSSLLQVFCSLILLRIDELIYPHPSAAVSSSSSSAAAAAAEPEFPAPAASGAPNPYEGSTSANSRVAPGLQLHQTMTDIVFDGIAKGNWTSTNAAPLLTAIVAKIVQDLNPATLEEAESLVGEAVESLAATAAVRCGSNIDDGFRNYLFTRVRSDAAAMFENRDLILDLKTALQKSTSVATHTWKLMASFEMVQNEGVMFLGLAVALALDFCSSSAREAAKADSSAYFEWARAIAEENAPKIPEDNRAATIEKAWKGATA